MSIRAQRSGMVVPWPYSCFMWEEREFLGSFVSFLVHGFSNECLPDNRVTSVTRKQQFSAHFGCHVDSNPYAFPCERVFTNSQMKLWRNLPSESPVLDIPQCLPIVTVWSHLAIRCSKSNISLALHSTGFFLCSTEVYYIKVLNWIEFYDPFSPYPLLRMMWSMEADLLACILFFCPSDSSFVKKGGKNVCMTQSSEN